MVRTALVVLIFSLFLGGAASAQTDDELAQAQELYDQGNAQYNVGEYEEAIAAFKRAYVLSKAPALLFNIAQSYRLNGDCGQATIFYRNYLRESPDAPNRADVEALVAECSTGKAKGPHEGRGQRIAGLAVGAAGLALVGTGVVFGVMAASDADELAGFQGFWGPDQEAIDQRGQRRETISFVLYGVGAAALIGGGVLYYLGMKAERPPVALTPIPGGAAFVWAGTFDL